MNNIICIAGPTASGKTALAVELAKRYNGEVVSCDSMQIYKRMDIGTAKPTVDEMQGIVHHMIDICEPEEDFSVSRYCAMASPIVDDIVARGKTAIIAGGTGLYMDSLIRGNDFAPFPSTGQREKLEAQTDEMGLEYMKNWLQSVDPEAAAKVHDRKRILRALEVFLETRDLIPSGWDWIPIPDRRCTTGLTCGWGSCWSRDWWKKSGISCPPVFRKNVLPCRPSAIRSSSMP